MATGMAAKQKRDSKNRKEDAEMEVAIRFYDVYSRTMEGLKKAFGDIADKLDEVDAAVFHGMGVVEEKVITQGINEGANKGGIYGVLDLLYNSNLQEYVGISKEGTLLRYDWAGNELTLPKPPNKPFTRFTYCAPTAHYICWRPNKTSFFLTREDFTVVIDSVAIAPIGNIIFGGRKGDDSFDFFIIAGASMNRYSYHISTNLVSLQDAMTISDIEADGQVIELTCFDDPKDDRKQWIYCTFETSCTIVDVTGRVHVTKRNLHAHKITAIAAIGGSDYVVTGDVKGILKLWGQRWAYIGEIRAHGGRITHIIEHPEGRASISFGKDQKLFVWSFDTQKEIESLPLPEVADRVVINNQRKGFMTQGPRKIVMWRMNSIVWLCHNTTAPMQKFLMSADNGFPRQAVAMCADNAVYILNAASGRVITTALISQTEPTMRCIAYRRHETGDTLYALVEKESMLELQLFDCKTNPAQLKETWVESKWDVGITCVAFYEYNPKITIVGKDMAFAKKRKAKQMPRTFLLCGRRDGAVALVNAETGKMDCVTAGHQSAVTHIEVDHEMNQAISLGTSPSLRLWRIGDTEDDLLVPLMDISWKHHPISVATILRNLVAFSLDHKDSNQHRFVVFNTSLAQKFDHTPENGHKMEILSISPARELLLFCTSSLDGTIAIRGPRNELYRVVVLNAIPSCAGFATPQGDILLGIGKGIYVLPGDKHLTLVPRNRSVQSGFSAGKLEASIPSSGKLIRDSRFIPEQDTNREMIPYPLVQKVVAEPDSQQSRNVEKLRLRNEDIRKIIEGRHPLEEIVPDFHNMSKQQWDEFGKSVYGDDGEDRKFFASESRMAAMLKLKTAAKDLDDFDNIA